MIDYNRVRGQSVVDTTARAVHSMDADETANIPLEKNHLREKSE
jgi:hypothetical protein